MLEMDITDTAILVVDDEESLRLTFKMFLSRAGYGPISTASTYEEAVELVENQDFDLIVSDIVMEGASGIDLLRKVKELGRQCPMVMVTGYPNINTATEAVELGAFAYLSKPVKKDDLLRTARMALQQYNLWKEAVKLQEEKELYQKYLETIFRSVRDIILTVDADMQITELNEPARKWLQELNPELQKGSNLNDMPGIAGEICREDVKLVLETRTEVPEHRAEWKKDDAQVVVCRISAAPMETKGGNFLGVVLVARDVSRLEALEMAGTRNRFHRFIGASSAMQTVFTLIENVGKVDTTVLVTGESGTGKELVADALHAESPRRDMPLVKVDCTAIPENLLESELFGHKKGSFTGADRDRKGRILQADGGTLFLDEIGDISSLMQLRLLRFLQERTFYPVGQDSPITVNVRVIAATNADLRKCVDEGTFREDLYYRLRVVDIILPPLRERSGDLPLLVAHFIERFNQRLGKDVHGISDQALELLESYHWPGNVRELEHVLERATILCADNTITTSDLPVEMLTGKIPAMKSNSAQVTPDHAAPRPTPATQSIPEDENETDKILRVLTQTAGNKAKAARLLGIDRSTLYRKIRLYNIDFDEPEEV
ncbi:MAG: sigma 54-interacting transcriptional regulator [Desulfobulbaceae bacterium]|nr:sigma 54-interacting transcriptional regulator [Desulfobulbaceae bacterium]